MRIESGASGPVTWTFKLDPAVKDASVQAALELLNVEDATVEGITFELGGIAHSALIASGTCPGVTFQNITAKNPKSMGFRINNASAEAGRPLKIFKSRVLGTAPYESGVNIHANALLSNQFIQVSDCRFEGPAKAAFAIEGPATGIELRNNRAFGFETGLKIAALPPDKPFGVKLERNTFHSLSIAGISLEGPLAGPQEVTVSRNYFANVPMLLKASNATGIQATDNARDAASKEGTIGLAAVAVEGPTLGLNKENDAEFLRPTGGAKLPVAGKTTAGAE